MGVAGGVSRCAQCAISGGRRGAQWCWGQVVVIGQPRDDDDIIVVVSAADGAMGPQGGPVCLPSSAKVGWGFTGVPPPSILSFAVPPVPLLFPLSTLLSSLLLSCPPPLSVPSRTCKTDQLIGFCCRARQQEGVRWGKRLPRGCDVARRVTGG